MPREQMHCRHQGCDGVVTYTEAHGGAPNPPLVQKIVIPCSNPDCPGRGQK
jgi:hypothetical protein